MLPRRLGAAGGDGIGGGRVYPDQPLAKSEDVAFGVQRIDAAPGAG